MGVMKNKFKERFSEIRKHSGLSQYDFKENIFVAQQTVSSWEQGRTTPNIDLLIDLSELFQCTVGQLIGTESLNVNELPIIKEKY